MFSRRVPSDLRPNRLAVARRGREVPYDLTESNPTRCGLEYPVDLLRPVADPAGLDYAPDPRGLAVARAAAAATYRGWGVEVDPDRVVLASSTSEAYGLLLRLLCDPGDAVLVPSPSYPLFDQLLRLDGVAAAPLRLDPDDGWGIDPDSLDAAPERTRAVVLVHPNNPTGTFVHPDDRRRIVDRCARHGWALIADEVFLPYVHEPAPGSDTSFAGETGCLTFTLGGLSKSVGLPGLKVAWIAVSGPDDVAEEAMERLDWVADAYLPVSTPVARALQDLIEGGGAIHAAIAARCVANLRRLEAAVAAAPEITLHRPAGGWSAVLRVPAVVDDESLALALLDRGVAVHPGYLFDFPSEGWLVLSLLPEEAPFAEGVRRLLAEVRDRICR